MIGDLTSSPEPIEIKLFSENPELLKEWAPKVGTAIKAIPGVTDVKNGIENTISGPAIAFNVDQPTAARAGFTPQEIELDASAILQGEPAATPVVVNNRSYTMRVRFPPRIAHRSMPSGTPCSPAPPARPQRSARWRLSRTKRSDGNPARKSTARFRGHGPS